MTEEQILLIIFIGIIIFLLYDNHLLLNKVDDLEEQLNKPIPHIIEKKHDILNIKACSKKISHDEYTKINICREIGYALYKNNLISYEEISGETPIVIGSIKVIKGD